MKIRKADRKHHGRWGFYFDGCLHQRLFGEYIACVDLVAMSEGKIYSTPSTGEF